MRHGVSFVWLRICLSGFIFFNQALPLCSPALLSSPTGCSCEACCCPPSINSNQYILHTFCMSGNQEEELAPQDLEQEASPVKEPEEEAPQPGPGDQDADMQSLEESNPQLTNGETEEEAADTSANLPNGDTKKAEKPKAKTSSTTKKDPDFPSSLEEFGYSFNEKGVLTDVETGGGFEFTVRKNNHNYNQKRYEALGEIVSDHIYELLETECGLEKHYLPIGAKETDARSFIFATPDLMENEDVLLVLIHGSGVVRAGQWARSIIINKSLYEGTQIPYINEAKQRGWAVIVLNTNLNMALATNEKGEQYMDYITGNGTPEEHVETVWDNFISKTKAQDVFIVAHSFGGVVTTHIADKREEEFIDRVTKIAFTDSVHSLKYLDASKAVEQFYATHVINWVVAPMPVNTEINNKFTSSRDCKIRSAGTMKHEMTSHCSKDSIFDWFSKCLGDEDLEDDAEEPSLPKETPKKTDDVKTTEATSSESNQTT